MVEVIHRDGGCKLFARILATLSVFIYQGTVFYAQLSLANELLHKLPDNTYRLNKIKGDRTIWLILETACFYLYMIAAMIYIFVRQMESACCDALQVSDMKKVLTDFITYSSNNLTWFAFNFVLVTMPPVCILLDDQDLWFAGKTSSYFKIIYTLWGMHILAFICQIFIYKRSPKDKADIVAHFDKDDQFRQSDAATSAPVDEG